MPDPEERRRGPNESEGGKPKFPGDNNVLPNNDILDDADMPDDLARDVSNEGVMSDPHERRVNP